MHRLALALPQTVEIFGEGLLDRSVKGTTLAWGRPLRRADLQALDYAAPRGPILATRAPDLGAKEARLAEDGEVYFTTPHFGGHPAILVRLDWVAMPELEELLVEAWLSRAPKRLATEYLDAPLPRPPLQDPRPPRRRSPVDRPAGPAGGPGARLHQPDLADEADDRRRGDQAAHLDDLRGAVLAAERQATEASRRPWDRVGVDEA